MAKVLQFDNSIQRYIKLSDKKMEEGDLVTAISYCFSAYSKEQSPEVLERIAKIYAEMGLYELSNEYWFNYLDKTEETDDTAPLEELATNYFYLEDYIATGYYLHQKIIKDNNFSENLDKNILDFFGLEEKLSKKQDYKIVYPPEEKDYSNEIKKADLSFAIGDYTDAIRNYNLVPEGNKDYLIAQKKKARALYLNSDYSGAISILKNILKKEENNLIILCELSSCFYHIKDITSARYYYKKCMEIGAQTEEELYILGRLSALHSDHNGIIKTFSLAVEKNPFDLNVRHVLGLAYINVFDYKSAYKHFAFIKKIVPDDTIASYYAEKTFLLSIGDKKKVELYPAEYKTGLPKAEEKNRIKYLKSIMEAPATQYEKLLKRPIAKKYLEWAIFEGEEDFSKECVYLMTGVNIRGINKILRKALLCPSIDNNLKKIIIYSMICSGVKGKISVVVESRYLSFYPKHFAFEKEKNGDFYYLCYSLCMAHAVFLGEEDFNKIALATNRIYKKLGSLKRKLKKEELCSLIFYVSGASDRLGIKEPYKLFRLNREDFLIVLNLYQGDINENNWYRQVVWWIH